MLIIRRTFPYSDDRHEKPVFPNNVGGVIDVCAVAII